MIQKEVAEFIAKKWVWLAEMKPMPGDLNPMVLADALSELSILCDYILKDEEE